MQSADAADSILYDRNIRSLLKSRGNLLNYPLMLVHISSADQLNINITPPLVEEVTKTLMPWFNVALANVMQNSTSQLDGRSQQRNMNELPPPPSLAYASIPPPNFTYGV